MPDLTEGPAKPGQAWRYELALAVAAIVSVGLSWAAARVLTAAGGFAAHPFPLTLAPLRLLWTHAWLTGWGVLELYGANFLGVTCWAGRTFAVIHLIGLALAIAAFAVALARLLRGLPLVDSVLAVAIVANLLSYLLSIEPGTVLGTGYDAREIAAVLPYGAVLAGRVFGPGISALLRGGLAGGAGGADVRLGGRRRGEVAWTGRAKKRDRSGSAVCALFGFSLVLATYGGALGYSATRPAVAGRDSVLAGWLVAHGLRYGLGGASANGATVDSGGRVVLEATTVRAGRVRALLYQSAAEAYDPRLHDANFLVVGSPADGVWDVNLLTQLRE